MRLGARNQEETLHHCNTVRIQFPVERAKLSADAEESCYSESSVTFIVNIFSEMFFATEWQPKNSRAHKFRNLNDIY